MFPGPEESASALSRYAGSFFHQTYQYLICFSVSLVHSAIAAASSVLVHTTISGAAFASTASLSSSQAGETTAAKGTAASASASATAGKSGAEIVRVSGIGAVVALAGALFVL